MNIKVSDIYSTQRARSIDQDHVEDLKKSIADKGLMQSVVVTADGDRYRLVAGEHRLEAFRQLGITKIPAEDLVSSLRRQGKIKKDEVLSDADLLTYEIEENIKRLSMTWQDRVLSVERYHKLAKAQASRNKEQWLQSQTGDILGIDQSYVSRFLILAERLRKEPEGPIAKAATVVDALRLLLQEKLDVAKRKQVDLLKQKQAEVKITAQRANVDVNAMKVQLPAGLAEQEAAALESPSNDLPKSYFYDLYFHGDALKTLSEVAKVKTINHIVTDPPYGIDMDHLLAYKNISDVVETHQVDANVALLYELLRVAREVIHPKGFMCMWYDLDHHNMLQARAAEVGWKVCRWPFVWAKTSSCMNQAAAYNFTKSTEVCMILRASEDSVLVQKQSNNFVLASAAHDSAHPFHKPFQVWERLINAVSYEGQTIVDPFAGSGSCLSAALTLNREPVGIEIDEKHISTGVDWMHNHHNTMAALLDVPVL